MGILNFRINLIVTGIAEIMVNFGRPSSTLKTIPSYGTRLQSLIDKASMDALITAAIDSTWGAASAPRQLSTPDDSVARSFMISASTVSSITITTERGSELTLQRAAFHATLRYLILNGHGVNNPCEIRSNDVYERAGPLCQAARDANDRTRVINYVVPIFADLGFVAVNGERPNSVWLV